MDVTSRFRFILDLTGHITSRSLNISISADEKSSRSKTRKSEEGDEKRMIKGCDQQLQVCVYCTTHSYSTLLSIRAGMQ